MYVHFEALNTQLTYFTVNDGDILRYRTKQCEYLQCGDENEMRFIKQWKADTQTHSHIQKCLYRTHIYTHTSIYCGIEYTNDTLHQTHSHSKIRTDSHIDDKNNNSTNSNRVPAVHTHTYNHAKSIIQTTAKKSMNDCLLSMRKGEENRDEKDTKLLVFFWKK